MFEKIVNYIKKEIRLTKEYYQGLNTPEPSPSDDEIETTYQGITYSAPKPITQEEYDSLVIVESAIADQIFEDAGRFGTDLVIMSAHGASCPDCAKYQGRVFSLTGNDKLFPKLPAHISLSQGIHPGCGHTFSTYIHGVTDPMLEYTLFFQDNVAPRYKKNIVAFSNRPFIDDRLPETVKNAEDYMVKRQAERDRQLYYEAHMIEIEAQRGIDKRDYKWLQENLPDICPKSYSGYKRMKNGNTKNYQKIVLKAKEMGRDIL